MHHACNNGCLLSAGGSPEASAALSIAVLSSDYTATGSSTSAISGRANYTRLRFRAVPNTYTFNLCEVTKANCSSFFLIVVCFHILCGSSLQHPLGQLIILLTCYPPSSSGRNLMNHGEAAITLAVKHPHHSLMGPR